MGLMEVASQGCGGTSRNGVTQGVMVVAPLTMASPMGNGGGGSRARAVTHGVATSPGDDGADPVSPCPCVPRAYLELDVTLSPEAFQSHAAAAMAHVNHALRLLLRLFLVEDLVDSLKVAEPPKSPPSVPHYIPMPPNCPQLTQHPLIAPN